MADREKVIKGLCDAIGIIHAYIPRRYWGYGEQACRDALSLLKEPNYSKKPNSSDQPEIVLCKDCKHSKSYSGTLYGCENGAGLHEPYWFCADGERVEGGGV